MNITADMKIKTIADKFDADMRKLAAEHKKMFAEMKKTRDELHEFNQMYKTSDKNDALKLEHKTKIEAYKKANDALVEFNKTVWKPTRQKLIAQFNADRAEIKRLKKEGSKKTVDVIEIPKDAPIPTSEVKVDVEDVKPLTHARVGEINLDDNDAEAIAS